MGNLKTGVALLLFLFSLSCASSTYGKFQADRGIPSFIKVGKTTRNEVFNGLGEPLVHRIVLGRETAIYSNERGRFYFLYGSYRGYELVIRFTNSVVSEVRIEKTGHGWGFLAPATSNNPGIGSRR